MTIASTGAIVLAAAGLLGYVPGLRVLGQIRSDYIPMAPSSAICLLILSVVLRLVVVQPWQRPARVTMALPVLLVVVFALLKFAELLSGRTISFENRLAPPMEMLGSIPIGRMSPMTGVVLTFVGIGTFLILLSPVEPRRSSRAGDAAASLGFAALLVTSPIFLSYVYGELFAYGGLLTPMALTTAIALLCLGVTLVATAGAARFPTRLAVGNSTSAVLTRAFVPLVVTAILIHGLVYHIGRRWIGIKDITLSSTAALIVGAVAIFAAARMARRTGKRFDDGNRRLRESEARYREITQSAHDAIITVDSLGIIVGWNPAAELIFGYSGAEIVGAPLVTLMPEELRGPHAAAMNRIASGIREREVGGTAALTGLRKSGIPFPIEVSLSSWTSGDRVFYTAIIRDTTERVHADEALRASESTLRDAQEIARIGSYTLDVQADSWRSSAVLDEIFGIGADFPRTTAGWGRVVHPDDRESMLSYLSETFAAHGQFNRTYRIVRISDGAERWVHGLGRVTYGHQGEAVLMLGTIQDITEREVAERQLRRNETSLAITLQSIGEGVIATDSAGFITRINEMAEHLTGWSAAAAIGRPVEDVFKVVDAQGRPLAIDPVRRVLARGSTEGTAAGTTLISRDDRRYQISETAAPIRDAAGNIEGVVLVFVDVSEEYRVRKALADSAELLERTGELANIGGCQLNLRNNELTWTRETYHIHELDPTETLTLERGINFFAPDARPVIKAAIQAAIDSGAPFDLELPLITATGRSIWVRALGSAVLENGRTVEVHGTFQDITERRKAEAGLRTLGRAVEQSPASIVITNPDGAIEYVNPRFEQVTGYSRAEALGKNPRILKSGVTPAETYQVLWDTILAGGEWRGELCNRRKNGELFWEHAVISGLKDARGHVSHFVGVKEDITERRRAEQEQAVMREHLTQVQRMESIGVLAGGVAHDFNNMLAAILGYAELTMLKLGESHAAYAHVAAIKAAAERSAELTGYLLAFARKQDIAPRVLSLNEVVVSLFKLLRRMLGDQVRLVWSPAEDLWPVQGDTSSIDQVVTNLAINARDAMEGRDGVLEVLTENVVLDAAFVGQHPAARIGEFVHLMVRDSGTGIDDVTRERLFEPFFTTKPAGKGTGLGLSTVHGIMLQHDGFLFVESTVGVGTTFHLYFPRAAGTSVEPVEPGPHRRAPTV